MFSVDGNEIPSIREKSVAAIFYHLLMDIVGRPKQTTKRWITLQW